MTLELIYFAKKLCSCSLRSLVTYTVRSQRMQPWAGTTNVTWPIRLVWVGRLYTKFADVS